MEISNIFEHLREVMEVRPSSITGADEGLHINGAVKKDQIIGINEGTIVSEVEG